MQFPQMMMPIPMPAWRTPHSVAACLTTWLCATLCAGLAPGARAADAAPYDHIVIVVLENRSANEGGPQRVYGNPGLPFFNQLANDTAHGARFANAWASETPYRRVPKGFVAPLSARPSQPNYLYLFSASHQGVLPPWFADPGSPYLDNVVLDRQGNRLPERLSGTPAGIGNKTVPAARRPLATANLGAALRAASKRFAMFSESLPHPLWDESGDPRPDQDLYRRKHNPAINWIDFGADKTPAKVAPERRRFLLPVEVNLTFHASTDPSGQRWRGFAEDADGKPIGYEQLPTVSIVVPNEQHDAHSASLEDADAWLKAQIGPYAAWAREHHSLLILTFDEDGSTDVSQGDPYMFGRHPIATVFYGAGVKPGVYRERIDALNVLATVLHDQGLLDTFKRDFIATCPEDKATCEREHANLRPIADVFGRGAALDELPPTRD
jgi:hypothetical protein